jgi:hypothetical protein
LFDASFVLPHHDGAARSFAAFLICVREIKPAPQVFNARLSSNSIMKLSNIDLSPYLGLQIDLLAVFIYLTLFFFVTSIVGFILLVLLHKRIKSRAMTEEEIVNLLKSTVPSSRKHNKQKLWGKWGRKGGLVITEKNLADWFMKKNHSALLLFMLAFFSLSCLPIAAAGILAIKINLWPGLMVALHGLLMVAMCSAMVVRAYMMYRRLR